VAWHFIFLNRIFRIVYVINRIFSQTKAI